MNQNIELGLDTFGDIPEGLDGKPLSHAQVIRNVVEEAVLADELGVDAIGVGEHHRADFAVSAPDVALAAISGGRAEVILGRGSFIESFPLFGFSLEDYELLFEEKLDLFAALLEQ